MPLVTLPAGPQVETPNDKRGKGFQRAVEHDHRRSHELQGVRMIHARR